MRIIPAIDIIDGNCVRLTKGEYHTKKIYNANPLEVAQQIEDNGIEYLHLVDLDGAKSGSIINYKVLDKLCNFTNLKIDFGGGIKSNDDLRIAFESGANQVTAGSVAVSNSSLLAKWLATYGSEKIILGADCKNRKIATNGWQEDSNLDIIDFIRNYETKGIKYVICTDIAKDGMLQGASIDLYREIIDSTSINLIASGGVSSIEDLAKLKGIGCEGAIIGKAFYEGKITLKEVYDFL